MPAWGFRVSLLAYHPLGPEAPKLDVKGLGKFRIFSNSHIVSPFSFNLACCRLQRCSSFTLYLFRFCHGSSIQSGVAAGELRGAASSDLEKAFVSRPNTHRLHSSSFLWFIF